MSFFTQYTFPRPLSKLYSDTKHVGDVVTEPEKTEEGPELSALHRKLRIQKDRLIAWGVEWSDSAAASQGDIEESVARAGVTETVTSVLNTIKDIYEEAERLQTGTSNVKVGSSLANEKVASRTNDGLWAASERARYEDLIKDLTESIDILYDLSRSRKGIQQSSLSSQPESTQAASSPFYSDYNASETTLVHPLPPSISFRSGLPPKVEFSDVILPEDEPPPYETPNSLRIRTIGRLRQYRSSTNPWKTDGSKSIDTPILVEYACFDPAYSVTGVSPPLNRLEEYLSAIGRLQSDLNRLGIFHCIGYFEDLQHSRYGIIYELPQFVYSGPVDAHKPNPLLQPLTLLQLLKTTSTKIPGIAAPPLEDRFSLSLRLTQTFSKLHEDSLVHKDLNSNNILLFKKNKPVGQSSGNYPVDYALRQPRVCSFDLFSEFNIDTESPQSSFNIYRHPNDPRSAGDYKAPYMPQFDMYSLGLILLEIGLWLPLGDLFKTKYTISDFKNRIDDVWIRKLAGKCGTAYMQAVRDCFSAADRMANNHDPMYSVTQIYNRILIRLERCCLLDEDESSRDWDNTISRPAAPGMLGFAQTKAYARKRLQSTQGPVEPKGSYPTNIVKRLSVERDTQLFEAKKKIAAPMASNHPGGDSQAPPSYQNPTLPVPLQDFWTSETLVEDDPGAWTRPQRPRIRTSSKGDIPEVPTSPRDRVSGAASTIQRAWRARAHKLSFTEYKRKVTVIQKQWRHRIASKSETTSTVDSQPISMELAAPGDDSSGPYPTPEPEKDDAEQPDALRIKIQQYGSSQRKLVVQPSVKFSEEVLNQWHGRMLSSLEKWVGRALKDSRETVSIDLLSIGTTPETAKPTIMVTCTSTKRVKAFLDRKFEYDTNMFDLKIRKGKMNRSKAPKKAKTRFPAHRSMASEDDPANPFHQERPLCGASIGAYNQGEHLPPVSFGGVVMVDGEPYGMSVHHMLDAPSDDEGDQEEETIPSPDDATRSSARGDNNPWLASIGSGPHMEIGPEILYPFEIQEDPLDDLGYDVDLDISSDEEDAASDGASDAGTEGDMDGVDVGNGDEIYITQPAFDDVAEGFFPCPEDAEEEHLDSHKLGTVHASSGIRRWNRNGILHEIDWALLRLDDRRLQPYNLVQGGKRYCSRAAEGNFCPRLKEPVSRKYYESDEDEYPHQIARADELGSLHVHCFGRTSGLKGGIVGSALSSVRIYRRRSFSRSWHVAGGFGGMLTTFLIMAAFLFDRKRLEIHSLTFPSTVGGDSGAWVIDNLQGRVCGHVLAWCEKNRIAYICPMEILIEDMKRTLGAQRIYLPGGEEDLAVIEEQLSNGIVQKKPQQQTLPERQEITLMSSPLKAEKDALPNIQELNLENGLNELSLAHSPHKSSAGRQLVGLNY
jgi:hypothetical protein